MYYTHPGYRTSIFHKNCEYYIQIFTVHKTTTTHLMTLNTHKNI